jgi:hypothetical protein
LLDEDADLAELITRMMRGELGRIFSRFHAPEHEPAHQVLRGWAQLLAEIDHLASARDFPRARVALDALKRRLIEEAAPLATAEPTSLYNPEALHAALGETTGGNAR